MNVEIFLDEIKNFMDEINKKYKNKYCFNNKIHLTRIHYTYLKEIKIEDLILERSSYVI